MPKSPAPVRKRSCDRKKISRSEDQGVTVEAAEEGKQVSFVVHNSTYRFVHVVVSVSGANLVDSEPKVKLLAPREDNVDLGTTRSANTVEPWSYRWQWTMTFDDPFAVHDDSVEYVLPFAPSKRLYCCQGVDGDFSHQGNLRYAIDWKARIGTPVLAARAGLVTRIQDGCIESGPLPVFQDKANFISITHSDNTVGEYVHLKYKGVVVDLGDRVDVGQLIGYSGNSGWSTTPHIHFHVFKALLYDPLEPDADKFVTLPIKFASCPRVPQQGDWCPPCVAIATDGQEIGNLPEEAPQKEYRSNGMTIYQFSRGDAAVELRVENENRYHARLRVDVNGQNVEISRPVPIDDIVLAKSGRFLVRVERTAESVAADSIWEWNFTFKFDEVSAGQLGGIDDAQLIEIYNLFRDIDEHENGYIDKNEYWSWLNSKTLEEVQSDLVDTMWDEMDSNGDEIVEFIEFLDFEVLKKDQRELTKSSTNVEEVGQSGALQSS